MCAADASARRRAGHRARTRARARSAPRCPRRCRSRRAPRRCCPGARSRRSRAGEPPGRRRRCSGARRGQRPGMSARKRSVCGSKPYSVSCSATHSAAPSAAGAAGRAIRVVPRELASELRRGRAVESGRQRRRRQRLRPADGEGASSSGRATSSHVPRTRRALIGRSSEPRRGRACGARARLGGAMARSV